MSPDAPPILLIGEALVDVFPDAAVLGGAPFNVARHLALLGASPLLVTRIGDDDAGRRIADEFAARGLDARGLQRDTARPSGTVRVELTGTGHRFHIAADVAWDAIDAEDAVAVVRGRPPALVCFGTLGQRAPASRAAVRAVLDASAATRVLDLNLRGGTDDERLAMESLDLADVVKVSDEELAAVLRWDGAAVDASRPWGDPRHVAAVRALMRRHGIARLVVTRGAEGWAGFDTADADVLEGAPAPVRVVDTVGAGDAFTSVLLLGLSRGWPLPTTLARAGDYASSVCTHRGSVDPAAGHAARYRTAWQRPAHG